MGVAVQVAHAAIGQFDFQATRDSKRSRLEATT